jgi:hypothetical protein
VELLAAFTAAARERHDAEVELVRTLGTLVRAGVIESLEHLPIDVHLALAHRYTRAERNMLLDAADMLVDMPATMRLWSEGLISWSQVRAMVTQLRRFGRPLRVDLDARLGASADLVELLDADRFEATVADAICDLRPPEQVERDEDAEADRAYLAAQAGPDGTASLHGEYDVPTAATVLDAIDTRADADTQQLGDRRSNGKRMSRAQRRARALAGICADYLAGHAGGPVGDRNGGCCRRSPARPLMVLHVPLDRITEGACGRLQVTVPGWLPTLSAKATEALAADADVRVVIFTGHRPLMVTEKLRAAQVPEDTRLAVAARDLGARDPGGRTPVGLSDLHHLGGDHVHDPDQMACVSPRGHHRIIHRHGWTGRVDPDTGQLTWTNPVTGRTITTLPWTTTLREAPNAGQ